MASITFHPAVQAWFEKTFGSPTEPQAAAWPAIGARRHTLVAAPTGSGKTLAAFLAAIDDLVRQGLSGSLPDATQVVYVSPLKALSNDIRKNLEEPLAGIRRELAERDLAAPDIRTLVRTGDTKPSERAAMTRRPPHILVTTPESLYILLTSDGGRRMLRTAHTLIVDEIHAVADDKRGSHLALSMERLESLAGQGLTRVGLSATQKPIEEVARFLVGARRVSTDGAPDCHVVDVGHRRAMDLALEVPPSPLEAVMSGEVWGEVYGRLAELVREHRTTLIFVNTRKLAERLTRQLTERLGADAAAAHHGSLSREQRLDAEQKLKAGTLRVLVATASLELGIDIGSVDLVCQIGSPRSIAAFLQRVGRSGHTLAGVPKGRIFPLSLDELVECAALLDAVRRGELDRLAIPEGSLDILAQQIVAMAAAEEWAEDALFERVTRAWPYRNLARPDFDAVVRILAEGFTTRRGRRGALIHHDAVGGRLKGRRGARLTAVTSGGAIPDNADYRVTLEPTETFLGTLNEDFAIESQAGDIFQLGNASWRILKVEQGRVRVADAAGAPPTIPFWLGEAPGRTAELSESVSRLRGELDRRLATGEAGPYLVEELKLSPAAARQMVEHLAAGRAALGALPTQAALVLERFFDEAGDMHVVLHSPFGSRLNRAWGLALRKRFCRQFNFELQAAANEDAIVLSLGPTHSFPLEDVFRYLNARTVRHVLTQALLDAPMFGIRWRWNAGRALAIPRFRGGKRVPPRLQRMEAEDLVAVVFPDQLACAENLTGEREVPDHPLVRQTIADCLEEAMDIERLEGLIADINRGGKTLLARELTEPSTLAHEILNAKPYAFLDDAPLEERRTQAVQARRWIDAETAAGLGALDAAAIERVRREAWPDVRDADELHDALVLAGFLTREEVRASGWEEPCADLAATRRAGLAQRPEGPALWIAAERRTDVEAVYPGIPFDPIPARLAATGAAPRTPAEALVELLRGRMETLGPVTARALALDFALPPARIEAALATLEKEGFVLRGRYAPGASEDEWCERRLLARIHRATLDRLRREIEPVSAGDYMRFLFVWQRALPDERGEGPESLAAVLHQLEGFEAPAAAWEKEILPARVADYDPLWLDALCLSGRFVWNRRRPAAQSAGPAETLRRRAGPIRTTPIAFLARDEAEAWESGPPHAAPPTADLSSGGRAIHAHLASRGASFFAEIVRATGLLRTQVEQGLGELVASGLASADSFAGLRSLLAPAGRKPPIARWRRRRGAASSGVETAGRWFSLPHGGTPAGPADTDTARRRPESASDEEVAEILARALLRRYGVVFRAILEREDRLPPWRDLVTVLRRMEARGEVRGGRFVTHFSGEQFALPEAVGRLREARSAGPGESLVAISAADPLNLAGITTPGEKLPALAGNRVLYRNGEPVAVLEARTTRFLVEMDSAGRWRAQEALIRRRTPVRLRALLER